MLQQAFKGQGLRSAIFPPLVGGFEPGLLGATYCVGDRGRKRWCSCAQTHDCIYNQKLAAIPAPGLLVEVLEILLGETVFGSKVVTVVISLDLVRMT
jgi:hypothetical protein